MAGIGSYVGYKPEGRIELRMDITLKDMAVILAHAEISPEELAGFVIEISEGVADLDFDRPLFEHFKAVVDTFGTIEDMTSK